MSIRVVNSKGPVLKCQHENGGARVPWPGDVAVCDNFGAPHYIWAYWTAEANVWKRARGVRRWWYVWRYGALR